MYKSVYSHIQDLVSVLSAEEPDKKMGKQLIHTIGISFNAEPFDAVKQRIQQDESKGLFDRNFQWIQLVLIMSNEEKTLWHKYILKLKPDGTKQDKGEVIFSDESGNSFPDRPIYITPEEVLKMFPNFLKGPDLDPGFPVGKADFKEIPGEIDYVNISPKDKGEKYKPKEFEADFEDAMYQTKAGDKVHMYLLIETGTEMHTPLGKKVEGKIPEPTPGESPEETLKQSMYRPAVRAAKEKSSDPISGGFSIVRDLFYKQHKDQKKKKAGPENKN